MKNFKIIILKLPPSRFLQFKLKIFGVGVAAANCCMAANVGRRFSARS